MSKLIYSLLALCAIGCNVKTSAQPQDNVDLDVEEGSERSGPRSYAAAVAPVRLRPAIIPRPLVECYTCTDCPSVQPNTTVKLCPYTADITKQNKCVVYSEKYNYMKKPWYIRGCASERGSCTEIKNAHSGQDIVRLLNCNECVGDKCNSNSVSRSLPDLTMAFLVLVLTPVLTKCTLA